MKPPPPATAIAATRLLRAWFAILIGLYAGLAVTMVGFAVVTGLMSRDLSTFWVMLLMATMYAVVLGIPVAAISALLALPLLAAQGSSSAPSAPTSAPATSPSPSTARRCSPSSRAIGPPPGSGCSSSPTKSPS